MSTGATESPLHYILAGDNRLKYLYYRGIFEYTALGTRLLAKKKNEIKQTIF